MRDILARVPLRRRRDHRCLTRRCPSAHTGHVGSLDNQVAPRQPRGCLQCADRSATLIAVEVDPVTGMRSGVPIVARTFHAIAYDIIGIVEGSKPALADHASDDLAFTNLIKQILKDLVYCLSEVSKAIIQFFAHFLVEPKTEWDFKTKHDFYTHMESQDLRTLQGEKVKSYEELQIANWLYENGVDCEYEPSLRAGSQASSS